MQELNTQEWARETEWILETAKRTLLESRISEIRDLAAKLPETRGSDEHEPISLAFAGQYSAGKSTILKALTGLDDIATGSGITTQECRQFDWNGMRVIDTPGIHTALRPDHDAISYDAISMSDLLVFVVTNELFDSHLANHFRVLTIDREKAHDTILVVNKMERTALGNTQESREIATEDLRKVLAPFTPEDLRITFTDAESALEATDEPEENLARMLVELSNMGELVDNLNHLVQDKGLNARHTTVLYTIDQIIQDAIAAEPTGDHDVDATILAYNQNIRAMRETRNQLQEATRYVADETILEVTLAAAECAEAFYPGASRDTLENAAKYCDAKLEASWNRVVDKLDDDYKEIMTTMGQQLDLIHDSHRFQAVVENLNRRSSNAGSSNMLKTAQKVARDLGSVSAKFTLNSARLSQGATGLTRYSGSAGHNTVLAVGHMLGHSFKPWQAVKFARGIGVAGNVFSVAGIALGIFMQVKADQQEEREDQEYLDKRRNIRAQMDKEAREIESEITSTANEYIHEALTVPIDEMQANLDELNGARQEQSDHLKQLTSVSSDARDMIKKTHGTKDRTG